MPSTSDRLAPAGKRNSAARIGPSPRVIQVAARNSRGSAITPRSASAAAIAALPPRGTTSCTGSASGPGAA
jgi:hypothetical protein